MAYIRKDIVKIAFKCLQYTGIQELLKPFAKGSGIIFTLHHVRPKVESEFDPNAMLEITPEYLDQVLSYLKQNDIDIISLDEVILRIKSKRKSRFFVCFTIDDGARDIAQYADPIFQKYSVPYTLYLVPDFIDRKAGPWWLYIEACIRELSSITLEIRGSQQTILCATPQEMQNAFCIIYNMVRYGAHDQMERILEQLAVQYCKSIYDQAEETCMSLKELKQLKANNPQLRYGAHSMSHALLNSISDDELKYELENSKLYLEKHFGEKIRTLAYPYGDPSAAGNREYAMAEQISFEGAVTTRPAMVFENYAGSMFAIPRVSLNGYYQSIKEFETLLTGVPFLLYNKSRWLQQLPDKSHS